MTVAADNSVVIAGLPQAAAFSGRPLSVVVECDTGRKRAGVETPAEAIALAREIATSKGLTFAGFMLYPTETGWTEAQKFYDEALAGVRAHGLEAAIVSTGGTPNLKMLESCVAPPSIGRAPTSTTIVCRWRPVSLPGTIAR